MSGPVFISYARPDRPYVEKLAEHLSGSRIPVWFDYELTAGDRWHQVIRNEIDRCAAFVVVMTPESEESDWVNREINRAEEKSKPIFPLLLRGDRFFRLSNIQSEDVGDERLPTPSFIARLVATVGAVVTGALSADTPSAAIRRDVRIAHPAHDNRPVTAKRILELVAELRERVDDTFLILEETEDPGKFFQVLLENGLFYVEYKLGQDGTHFGTITSDETAVENAALGWARGEDQWKQAFPWWKKS